MPTRQGGNFSKNRNTSARRSLRLNNGAPAFVCAVYLKNQFGQIQSDYGNLFHGTVPPCGVCNNDHASTSMPSERAVPPHQVLFPLAENPPVTAVQISRADSACRKRRPQPIEVMCS